MGDGSIKAALFIGLFVAVSIVSGINHGTSLGDWVGATGAGGSGVKWVW
jgi:hypothetical protein